MTRRTLGSAAIALTLALAFAAACDAPEAPRAPDAPRAPAAPDAQATEDARLNERQQEFFAAMGARDANRVAALFTDGAYVHVANMPPIEGRAAIRAFYVNLFGFLAASSATAEATHVSEGGAMAYSVGRTRNEFAGPEGPVEYTGKYALVWVREDGEWWIALYAISSNQAEARPGG